MCAAHFSGFVQRAHVAAVQHEVKRHSAPNTPPRDRRRHHRVVPSSPGGTRLTALRPLSHLSTASASASSSNSTHTRLRRSPHSGSPIMPVTTPGVHPPRGGTQAPHASKAVRGPGVGYAFERRRHVAGTWMAQACSPSQVAPARCHPGHHRRHQQR